MPKKGLKNVLSGCFTDCEAAEFRAFCNERGVSLSEAVRGGVLLLLHANQLSDTKKAS